jgi:hypothetical protein
MVAGADTFGGVDDEQACGVGDTRLARAPLLQPSCVDHHPLVVGSLGGGSRGGWG